MYIDPLKDIRGVISQKSADLRQATNMALKPTLETRAIFNKTFQQTRPIIKPLVIDNSSLLKLNIQVNLTSQQFRKNLFSDKILNDFIKSTTISENKVLEMSNVLRNFSVNVVTTSIFTESINSSHPVDEPKKKSESYEFKKILNSHVIAPSNKLVNTSSKTIFVETIADFVLRLIHQDPVNTSVYIWVLFFSYLGFCLTSNEDNEKH